MTTPSRRHVESWQQFVLEQWAARVEIGDLDYMAGLDRARNHMTEAGSTWSGITYDAAYDRVGEDHDEGRKLSFEVIELVTGLRQASWRLDGDRTAVLSQVSTIESDTLHGVRFSVDDRWRLSMVTPPGMSEEEQSDANQRFAEYREAIGTAVERLTTTVGEIGSTITTHGEEIRTRGDQMASATFAAGPAGWESERELTAELGRDDGATIADGRLSDAEIDRIADHLGDANLTPEQLTALANGQDVTLPANTLDYLTTLYDTAGTDGLLRLSEQLDGDTSPDAAQLRQDLANGLLTISHENISGIDSNGMVTGRGGFEHLPPGIQDLISSRGTSGGLLPGDTGPLPPPYNMDVNAYRQDTTALADLLAESDPSQSPGEQLGIELTRQAAFQAALADNSGTAVPGYELPDTTLQHFLEVGTRNTDANYALITGNDTNGYLTPDQHGTPYHRDSALVPLLLHEWDDDGQALVPMFSWINDGAPVDPTNPDNSQASRAGEAAFGLAQLLSTTESGMQPSDGSEPTGPYANIYGALLDVPGHIDGTSFGQLNPIAAQGIAEALQPYAGKFVGLSDNLTGTTGFENLGGPIEAVRVVSVLNGDPLASQHINSALLAESMRLDGVFATEAASGTAGSIDLGYAGSDLRWLVDKGLNVEIGERQGDTDASAAERQQRVGSYYTAAQIALGGLGPGPAIAAAGSELLRPGIVDIDPATAYPHAPILYDEGQFNATQFGTEPHRMYQMVQTLTHQGVLDFDSLPERLKDGERFLTYAELANTSGSYSSRDGADTFVEDLRTALVGGGVDQFDLDRYLMRGGGLHDNRLDDLLNPQNLPGTDLSDYTERPEITSSPNNSWPIPGT